jgi:DNA topoisomerase-3
VITKPKSKRKPVPLTTVELQKLASRKLKFSATDTMSIAESLYNQGYVSYPRTGLFRYETNIAFFFVFNNKK